MRSDRAHVARLIGDRTGLVVDRGTRTASIRDPERVLVRAKAGESSGFAIMDFGRKRRTCIACRPIPPIADAGLAASISTGSASALTAGIAVVKLEYAGQLRSAAFLSCLGFRNGLDSRLLPAARDALRMALPSRQPIEQPTLRALDSATRYRGRRWPGNVRENSSRSARSPWVHRYGPRSSRRRRNPDPLPHALDPIRASSRTPRALGAPGHPADIPCPARCGRGVAHAHIRSHAALGACPRQALLTADLAQNVRRDSVREYLSNRCSPRGNARRRAGIRESPPLLR